MNHWQLSLCLFGGKFCIFYLKINYKLIRYRPVFGVVFLVSVKKARYLQIICTTSVTTKLLGVKFLPFFLNYAIFLQLILFYIIFFINTDSYYLEHAIAIYDEAKLPRAPDGHLTQIPVVIFNFPGRSCPHSDSHISQVGATPSSEFTQMLICHSFIDRLQGDCIHPGYYSSRDFTSDSPSLFSR